MDIFAFIKNKDFEQLQKYLLDCKDRNPRDKYGSTLLRRCCSVKWMQGVKYMIEKGADIKPTRENGWTLLHECCEVQWMEGMKYLVEKGAHINCTDKNGLTALHRCCKVKWMEGMKYLVEKGADINCRDEDGLTPLHICSDLKWIKGTRVLIMNNADPGIEDKNGESSYDLALTAQNLELINLILQATEKIIRKPKKNRTRVQRKRIYEIKGQKDQYLQQLTSHKKVKKYKKLWLTNLK